MKKFLSSFLGLAAFAVLAVGLMVPLASAQSTTNVSLPRSITVYGDGKVSVKPDRAILNIQVEGKTTTSSESQEKRKKDLSVIVNALEKAGIKDVKVRTTWFNAYPQYDYSQTSAESVMTEKTAGGGGLIMPADMPAKINGYSASHSVSVNVPFADLDKTHDVLEKITEIGTVNVTYVNVSVDNPEMHLEQARQDAAENARARAEKWATIFGTKVGKVMTVSDYNSYAYYGSGEYSFPYSYSSNPGEDMMVDLTVQIQVLFEMM